MPRKWWRSSPRDKIFSSPIVTRDRARRRRSTWPRTTTRSISSAWAAGNPYCSFVIEPKVAKFRKQYLDRLKNGVAPCSADSRDVADSPMPAAMRAVRRRERQHQALRDRGRPPARTRPSSCASSSSRPSPSSTAARGEDHRRRGDGGLPRRPARAPRPPRHPAAASHDMAPVEKVRLGVRIGFHYGPGGRARRRRLRRHREPRRALDRDGLPGADHHLARDRRSPPPPCRAWTAAPLLDPGEGPRAGGRNLRAHVDRHRRRRPWRRARDHRRGRFAAPRVPRAQLKWSRRCRAASAARWCWAATPTSSSPTAWPRARTARSSSARTSSCSPTAAPTARSSPSTATARSSCAREEPMLRGHGFITLGQSRSTATEFVEFFCE